MMDERNREEMAKILLAVGAALERFYENPRHRCADCGKSREFRPTMVAERDATRAQWEVNSWTFRGEASGWVQTRPNVDVVNRVNEKPYCPSCAEKRGIDFTKEHEEEPK